VRGTVDLGDGDGRLVEVCAQRLECRPRLADVDFGIDPRIGERRVPRNTTRALVANGIDIHSTSDFTLHEPRERQASVALLTCDFFQTGPDPRPASRSLW
jgi:hypothetical protein